MTLTGKRWLMLILSVIGIGLGIALFRWSGLGNDPISALNLAVSAKTGISFGTIVLAGNLLMFTLVLWLHRESIGVGTLVNMIFVGYIVDFFTWLFRFVGMPTANTLVLQLGFVLVGVVELSLSCSLYFTVGLGVAPYDAMAFILEKYTRVSFAKCRVFTDCISAAAALALGGLVSIGTLVSAFCLGPFINFFNRTVSIPLLGATPVSRPEREKE